MKIAICDDEKSEQQLLCKYVEEWAARKGQRVELRCFDNAENFLFSWEDEKDYGALILDIEMGSMSGMELAKKIREGDSDIPILFVTGYAEYMQLGYDVKALHYLMKPVSCERLWTVLARAAANLAREEKRLCVTFERRTDYVFLSRILYIEAQKQYVLIHTFGETYRMKKSLTKTEAELDEYFLQVQRSFCVNLRHVTKIKKGSLMLKNGEEIPISRGMAERISREMIRLF